MHRMVARSLVALTLLAVPAAAGAQEDEGQLDEAARLTFESAREAFVQGDYERALARFRQAYELSPRPGLLYNIAQSLDRLRRDEETVQVLRAYLEAVPDATNRAEVEARIRVLERALAERQTAPPAEEAPAADPIVASDPVAAEPAPDDGGLHPALALTAGGLALVGAGLTIWSGLRTMELNDAYLANGDAATVAEAYDEAATYQTMTNVFIAATATFGVAAAVLAIFTDWDALTGGSSESTSASASLRPIVSAGPNGGMVGVGGHF